MAEDAADRRPRRAFSSDDAGEVAGPPDSPRARRSFETWPTEDEGTPSAAERGTPAAAVPIQSATPPARDVQITTVTPSPEDPPAPAPDGLAADAGAWGRPGPMPTDPRPTSSRRPTQRSASSPPPMWTEPHRHVLDRRTRTGLLLSAVALLVVASLSVGFAVWANQRPQASAPVAPTTSTPSPSPTPVLGPTSMLTDADAAEIDPDAAWKVSLDIDQVGEESPQATCIVSDQDGLPVPESTRLRTLTTATDLETAALHQADLYATSEDAQTVFASRLEQLGGCAKQPVYLSGGWSPADLGNESGGVVAVVQDQISVHHSLLLVRSGRMVNVIDVAQQNSPVDFDGLVSAAAEVVNSQCGKTAGRCATDATSRGGVPPLGTEEPGFLAGADIPRLTPSAGEWGGTPVESDFGVTTSQCEGMNPADVNGPTDRAKVTYLLRNDAEAPQAYGFDEVVLSMEDAEAATELREGFDEAVEACPDDLRTAEVSEPVALEGAVGGSEISGNAYTVTQSVEGSEDVLYRIALATIEEKVVYLVLPTTEDFDFSDARWRDVAIRAAERTTQG